MRRKCVRAYRVIQRKKALSVSVKTRKIKKKVSKEHKSIDICIKIVYNIFCMDTVGDCLFFAHQCEKATLIHEPNGRCTLCICICLSGIKPVGKMNEMKRRKRRCELCNWNLG